MTAARGVMIASPRSGSGKTCVTVGLLAALARRGVAVRAAKAGPDYIDPAFHAAACGRDSVNLDGWAMGADLLRGLAGGGTDGSLLVVEAAMGLFDGAGGTGPGGTDGSAAGLARLLGLPVVLVIDVSGQAQSAAAVAQGFARFDPSVRVAGVVLNRVGSARHASLVSEACRAAGIAVFGCVGRDEAMALPSRHLGLVQAGETEGLGARIDAIAALVEGSVDLDAILAAAGPIAGGGGGDGGASGIAPPGQRIALACDAAFGFAYPHLVGSWRAAGASVVPFSPLADEPPDPSADAVWLPGGYPELHAGRLAGNRRFLDGLRAARGVVHGECGGYMVLGEAITDADGVRHVMAGLLAHETSFARRRLQLGYRQATLLADGALGWRGAAVAGHEFHYATLLDAASGGRAADAPLARVSDGRGDALGDAGGWAVSAAGARVSGSFFHAIAPVASDARAGGG